MTAAGTPRPPLPRRVPRRLPRRTAPARLHRRSPPRRRCPPTGAGRPTRASRATIGRRSATAQLVSGSIGAQDAAPLFVWFPQPSPRTSFVAVQRFWFVVLMAGLGARPGATQARASFGVGAGTVRYSGGTSFSSATFSPAAGFASLHLAADVSGSFASLPGRVWSGRGHGAAVRVVRPDRRRHRVRSAVRDADHRPRAGGGQLPARPVPRAAPRGVRDPGRAATHVTPPAPRRSERGEVVAARSSAPRR